MIILRLDNVSYTHPGGPGVQNLTWAIADDARLGFVGPNGAGKSTILNLLAGRLLPDRGFMVTAKGASVGYLPQEVRLDPLHTVLIEAMTASARLAAIEADLEKVTRSMEDPAVYDDEKALARALDQQQRLLTAYAEAGGLQYENSVKATLRQLGFDDSDFDLPTAALSGGQKKLLALTKLAVNRPACLLLDEPDNHLDLAGKAFLEGFIRTYPGAVVIVSHDRYLLDEVADNIVELEGGKLEFYIGNYTAYVVERELRRLRQAQMAAAQQKEISRLEASIARMELWASLVSPRASNRRHVIQARNKRRQIERMDKVDAVVEQRTMGLELEGWRGSSKVLEIIDLVKAFDDDLVLAGANLLLWHGERVGLVGPNGAGKSVLFRCIIGALQPTSGVVKIGPSVKMGVYTQEHQSLDYSKTLVEMVREVKPMYEREAAAFLTQFLFEWKRAHEQTVGSLSGGERSRLQMALLMLQQPNFLLLDEPTNNLDIASCEVLERALDDFDGTVLVISHDRYFLDQTVDRIVELDPDQGVLVNYTGGYTDYLEARRIRSSSSSSATSRS